MTDRRPDIYCASCGVYLYSGSHRPETQRHTETERCGECRGSIANGVRSVEMLRYAWKRFAPEMRVKYQDGIGRELTRDEQSWFWRFVEDSEQSGILQGLPLRTTPPVDGISELEWISFAQIKINGYLRRKSIGKQKSTLLREMLLWWKQMPLAEAA